MIRILLLDEHTEVRAQLAARLGREPDFAIVCEPPTPTALLGCARQHQPHIVLVDPPPGDIHILRALTAIKQETTAAIVILTSVVDTYFQVELQRAGVDRILTKGIESSDLVTELRAVATRPPTSPPGQMTRPTRDT